MKLRIFHIYNVQSVYTTQLLLWKQPSRRPLVSCGYWQPTVPLLHSPEWGTATRPPRRFSESSHFFLFIIYFSRLFDPAKNFLSHLPTRTKLAMYSGLHYDTDARHVLTHEPPLYTSAHSARSADYDRPFYTCERKRPDGTSSVRASFPTRARHDDVAVDLFIWFCSICIVGIWKELYAGCIFM